MADQSSIKSTTFDTRFTRVIENMSNGVVIYEITPEEDNFTVTAINRPALEMAQRPREKIIGKLITEAFPGVKDYGLFDVLLDVYRGKDPKVFPPKKYIDEHRVGWFKNFVYTISDTEVVAFFEDVTDQMTNEQKIKTALSRLETITDASGLGVWHRDLKTDDVTFNQNLLDIYQFDETFSPEDLTYEYLAKYIHPDDLIKLDESTKRVIETEQPDTIIFRINRTDGELRYIEAKVTLELDEEGLPASLVGTNEDITKEHTALLEGKHLEQLTAQIPGYLYQFIRFPNGAYQLVYTSAGVEELYGLSSDTIRKDFSKLANMIHPDDIQHFMASIELSAENLTVWSQEFRVILEDSSVKYIKAISKPEKFDDDKIIWHGYNWDITEEKHREAALEASETRFRLASEATGLGIWRWNILDDKIAWSDEAFTMLGYSPEAFPLNLSKFQALVHPDDVTDIMDDVNYNLERNQGFFIQFRLETADKDWLWVESRGKATELDDKGKPITMMGTHMDISVIKESENQLRDAQQKAEQATKAKSEFLANVSHEIRTPMSGVMGMVDLLLAGDLSDQQKQYASNIRYSAQSLLEIINDILDYSKIEAGEMTITETVFNLYEVVKNTVTPFEQVAHERQLDFVNSITIPNDHFYTGDPQRIQQVLNNLLSNACKFTQKGSIEVKLSVTEERPQQDTILIEVIDTGIGIAGDDLDKLFRRFSQVESSNTRRFSGTGLGLAISKNLVELMGGEIGVDSQHGMGSRFWFTLKLPLAYYNETPGGSRQELKGCYQGHVLVVEDNVINQQVATGVLSKLGLTVDLANNGKECLKLMHDNAYDIIFMDLQMPYMDGLEATQRIRNGEVANHRADVPIIAVTANVLPEEREQCLASGMNGHIAKPIELDAIIEELDKFSKPC